MKKMLFVIILFVFSANSFAQEVIKLKKDSVEKNKIIITDRPPQAVYMNFGGSALFYAFTYDRRFKKRLNGFGFSAGLGVFAETGLTAITIPVSINYLAGRKNHFAEFAAGATYASASVDFFDASSSDNLVIGHINIGYRYQHSNGGFFGRVGISPLFAQGEYFTSAYLGLGYCF